MCDLCLLMNSSHFLQPQDLFFFSQHKKINLESLSSSEENILIRNRYVKFQKM